MKKLYFATLRYLKLFKSFKMLLFLSSILFSLQSRAQFQMPTIPAVNYPSPVSSSDYINSHTAYLSNYASDHTTHWYATHNKGIAVSGWTQDAAHGGGGKIAVGTYSLSTISTPFVGAFTIDVPHAIDLRVGTMGDFIVAAYYNQSTNQYQFSYWHWGGPGTTVSTMTSYTLPIPATITVYERISMDINLDGTKAALVLSNAGKIWGIGIELVGAIFNYYPPNELSGSIGFTDGNIYPDVSFNWDYTSSVPKVYFTYFNNLSVQQSVYSIDWSIFTGVMFGFPVGLDTYTPPASVSWVNFDCPDHYALDHWAYTYATNTIAGGQVFVRADTGSGAYTACINNGSVIPLSNLVSPFNTVNEQPDIAYTLNMGRDEVTVAWATNAPGTFMLTPPYSYSYITASIALNGTGGPIVPKSTSGPDYALIPDAYDETPIATPLVAINRRVEQANRYVSYFTDTPSIGYQLKHKNIDMFNPFYRQSQQPNTLDKGTTSMLKLYPNPFSDVLYLQIPQDLNGLEWSMSISDILGKLIYQYKGKTPNTFLEQISPNLITGQYFIKLQYSNNTPQTIKITKQ